MPPRQEVWAAARRWDGSGALRVAISRCKSQRRGPVRANKCDDFFLTVLRCNDFLVAESEEMQAQRRGGDVSNILYACAKCCTLP